MISGYTLSSWIILLYKGLLSSMGCMYTLFDWGKLESLVITEAQVGIPFRGVKKVFDQRKDWNLGSAVLISKILGVSIDTPDTPLTGPLDSLVRKWFLMMKIPNMPNKAWGKLMAKNWPLYYIQNWPWSRIQLMKRGYVLCGIGTLH